MTPEWLKFEEAIAAFCQALTPDAKVRHNKITPDSDTGEPRQRDVWIEASLGGYIAIKLLVDQPPPIPEMLLLEAYHLYERFRPTAEGLSGPPGLGGNAQRGR